MVENQTDRKIKEAEKKILVLSFVIKFDYMCNGIVRHKTVAYTLQQNGVAEDINKKIMDKVRIMQISFSTAKWN